MVDRVRANAKLQHEGSRGQRRMDLYSKARGLEAEQKSVVTVGDFNAALSSLETDTHASLSVIKRAFIQDPAHIVNFLRHKSALHFVVGRLISSDPYEQLEALECCCNASLGDMKSCSLVANAGAIYIIQIVHGTNLNLINVALITLGNLSLSGINTCKLLHQQGLINALMAAMKVDETTELAAKALCQFSFVYGSVFNDDEIVSITECSLPFFDKCPAVQWLVAQFSAYEAARIRLSNSGITATAIDRLNSTDKISADNLRTVTALIRLLGNMAAHIPDESALRPEFSKGFET